MPRHGRTPRVSSSSFENPKVPSPVKSTLKQANTPPVDDHEFSSASYEEFTSVSRESGSPREESRNNDDDVNKVKNNKAEAGEGSSPSLNSDNSFQHSFEETTANLYSTQPFSDKVNTDEPVDLANCDLVKVKTDDLQSDLAEPSSVENAMTTASGFGKPGDLESNKAVGFDEQFDVSTTDFEEFMSGANVSQTAAETSSHVETNPDDFVAENAPTSSQSQLGEISSIIKTYFPESDDSGQEEGESDLTQNTCMEPQNVASSSVDIKGTLGVVSPSASTSSAENPESAVVDQDDSSKENGEPTVPDTNQESVHEGSLQVQGSFIGLFKTG